jgi:hypothetical protein
MRALLLLLLLGERVTGGNEVRPGDRTRCWTDVSRVSEGTLGSIKNATGCVSTVCGLYVLWYDITSFMWHCFIELISKHYKIKPKFITDVFKL